MSKEIDISYTWDKETYVKASKVAYDYELKKSNRKYIGWFFIALTQFGVVAAMKKGSISLLLVSSFLVLYWYFFRWGLRKKVIETTFDKLENANQQYNVKISNEQLTINESPILWEDISQVTSLKDGLFIYLNQNSIFIPSSAFKNMEEKNDFLTLLKEKVSNYTRGE